MKQVTIIPIFSTCCLFLLPYFLTSCKTLHQQTLPESTIHQLNNPEQQETPLAATTLPEPSLTDHPSVTIPAINVTARPISKQAAITAAIRNYHDHGTAEPLIMENNFIRYPYGLAEAKLACASLRVCSIELEPGEQVLNIVSGDTQRWDISTATSGPANTVTPHVIVKPLYHEAIDTNLIITTSKRVYTIHLTTAQEGNFTPRIGFFYPREASENNLLAPEQHRAFISTSSAPLVDIHNIHFSYIIEGDSSLAWYPERIFDDGRKVFIEMPGTITYAQAPIFLALGADGEEEIINYRYKHPFYIIDRLFTKGVLLLRTKKEETRITLSRSQS